MEKLHRRILGSYQTNCYILQGENSRCLITDPGCEPESILAFLRREALTAEAILLTHGHFDHVGAVRALASELGCPVYIHEAELSLPAIFTAGPLFYTDFYKDGDTLSPAGLSLQVMHTPGHTPGSVCLLHEDILLSGDTLFAGSWGRTDFPGGSMAQLRESLRQLAALEKNYTVYPGHGESTTLARERMYNPLMKP